MFIRMLVLLTWPEFSFATTVEVAELDLLTTFSDNLEHETNSWVQNKINFLVGLQEPRLATIKRWKLAWFGHVTCHNSLSKTILQGTLEGLQHHASRGNAGWTTSRSGYLCPCQNCSQRPPAEKTGRGSYQSRDWTELNDFHFKVTAMLKWF